METNLTKKERDNCNRRTRITKLKVLPIIIVNQLITSTAKQKYQFSILFSNIEGNSRKKAKRIGSFSPEWEQWGGEFRSRNYFFIIIMTFSTL